MRPYDILLEVLQLNEIEAQGTVYYSGSEFEDFIIRTFGPCVCRAENLPEGDYFYTYGTPLKGEKPDAVLRDPDQNNVYMYRIDE